MSMETYRMEVSENAEADELLVDINDIDGLVEGAFAVRLLGDGEELLSERVTDADWGSRTQSAPTGNALGSRLHSSKTE